MSANFRRKGRRLPTIVSENWSDCSFAWYQNIHSAMLGFVTNHADGQNYDSQDRASIAALRGKNTEEEKL